MTNYDLHFSFTHVPPVMKRHRHALILLENEEGKFVLGAKNIYPKGIYRLAGGGLDGNENEKLGAMRELKEEFGVEYDEDDIQLLATITAESAESSSGKIYSFVTYLFHAHCQSADLHPSDDLDGMQAFTREEINALIDRYYDLSDELITLNDKPVEKNMYFRWSDYGKFYGRVHEIAMELV